MEVSAAVGLLGLAPHVAERMPSNVSANFDLTPCAALQSASSRVVHGAYRLSCEVIMREECHDSRRACARGWHPRAPGTCPPRSHTSGAARSPTCAGAPEFLSRMLTKLACRIAQWPGKQRSVQPL